MTAQEGRGDCRVVDVTLKSRLGQNRIYIPYIRRFPCQKYRKYNIYIYIYIISGQHYT
jgi:hypothetical protein